MNITGQEVNGLDIFRRARENNPYITACLMTGDLASSKMREIFDAFNALLIEKPFATDTFEKLLDRAKKDLLRRKEAQPKVFSPDPLAGFVAESPNMKHLLERIKKLAPQKDLSIYLTGPTGTGKTVLAKAIHELSSIKGPFKTFTCSAVSPQLADSSLFGHRKGSFTGATEDREGIIHEADGGTLFLDELQLLPKEVQAKLLRVLDTGVYVRVGETRERQSRFRLITASSVDIRHLTSRGEFIPDLWYRISTTTLQVPSLAERKACIPRLVYRFLNEFEQTLNRKCEIEPAALDVMVSFSWDGNIRDLRSSIRALCGEISLDQKITRRMVEEDLKRREGSFIGRGDALLPGESLPSARRRIEVELITSALRKTSNNKDKAAKILGVPRQTLRSRMIALGLERAS